MNHIPTFTQFFDGLVSEKKQQIHKASDADAFDAAVIHCEKQYGFLPDSGLKAYKKRKNSYIKGKK